MGKIKEIFVLFKDTFDEWNRDHAATWAAALAYYTIFSVGPLLLLAISIAGLVFGHAAAQGQITGRIEGIVGQDAAQVVQQLLQAANKPASGIIGTVIGIATLLLGASGFFGQLQSALNAMWGVRPPRRSILQTVQARSVTFLMVVGVGVLLVALLALSAAIAAVTAFFGQLLPGSVSGILLGAVDFVVSLAVITAIFAAIYKILPDTSVAWKDVWVGAAITALLFTIGKVALGIYLGRASVGSAFGAAGSLVVLLVWIYYSAQIFLFGAEFTQVYSNKYGPKLAPAKNAEEPRATRETAERGDLPEARGNGRAKQESDWEVGKAGERNSRSDEGQAAASRRVRGPAPVRAAIVQLSIVAGIVTAAVDRLRGRREAS